MSLRNCSSIQGVKDHVAANAKSNRVSSSKARGKGRGRGRGHSRVAKQVRKLVHGEGMAKVVARMTKP